MAEDQHVVPEDSDAVYELRRARARIGSTFDSMVASELLKDCSKDYKTFLLSILSMDDKDEPQKNKTKRDDDRDNEEETDPEYELALQKLKKMDKSSAQKFEKGQLPSSSLLS